MFYDIKSENHPVKSGAECYQRRFIQLRGVAQGVINCGLYRQVVAQDVINDGLYRQGMGPGCD